VRDTHTEERHTDVRQREQHLYLRLDLEERDTYKGERDTCEGDTHRNHTHKPGEENKSERDSYKTYSHVILKILTCEYLLYDM